MHTLDLGNEHDSSEELLTVAQASAWATRRAQRKVTPSNISYLIKYGQLPASDRHGAPRIKVQDLEQYYNTQAKKRENRYKDKLGNDINWRLSFEQYKEAETTKHVHRLHPYKGKFIPQLVEYFLDAHTDEFKQEACFAPGDLVLDPFCGSGTTLVQSNELGIHAVGVDVSPFNAMISNLKLGRIDLGLLSQAAAEVSRAIANNPDGQAARALEEELLEELRSFNSKHFPAPDFRRRVRAGEINEDAYGAKCSNVFRSTYLNILRKHPVSNLIDSESSDFLKRWYLPSVLSEMRSAQNAIEQMPDRHTRDVLRLVLSRSIRSGRATTHSDLATLVRPITEIYYCGKHSKICKPLFSMLNWWKRYASDTIKRKSQFEKLRTDTLQTCLIGDSRSLDIPSELASADGGFSPLLKKQKIHGIFSSPPYVGLIDYHEQHAYAYELFDLPRNDDLEIGPLSGGRNRAARENYVADISQVLCNCQKYMADNCDIFLVANDKFNLYPQIAERSGLGIYKEYKRPVLNRAEGNKGAYAETIFHLRKMSTSCLANNEHYGSAGLLSN